MLPHRLMNQFGKSVGGVKVLEFCRTAARLRCRLRRSILPRPVHESSFLTLKEVYETSKNRIDVLAVGPTRR